MNNELLDALKKVSDEFYPCEMCEGTGNNLDDPESACRICGGYGFNPGGDIRQAIVEARTILDKVGNDEH